MIIFDAYPVTNTQVGDTLRHGLISATFQPNLYPVTVLLPILLLYLVTDDGTPYCTCHSRDIIAGAPTYLISENATYNTADNSANTDFIVVTAYGFDVINHTVSRSGRRIIRSNRA
jgi:hypothetical protein